MRFIKKLNERGTVTLPSDIREVLMIGDGDVVEFEIIRVVRHADGRAPVASQEVRA